MSPTADGSNKKRKHDPGPSPSSQHNYQSDTASILSNLPALPPAPTSSPPSQSQTPSQNNNNGGGGGTITGTTSHTSGGNNNNNNSSNQRHPTSSSAATKRPKRARGKTEKKEENECPSRFHCDYCGRDLSFSVRARCAICPDYDSCLDCFSVGAALLPHKANHDYRLIEVVHAPIFQEEWSADEEEKLLEGLETFGVGNWEQVAKLIGSKNAIETEKHYLDIYLNHPAGGPLPNPNHLAPAVDHNALAAIDAHLDLDDQKALRVMHKHQQEDAAGWMPKRQDFVYEWDNEAEDIIGDMDITEEDTKTDRDLKLQVLEIYCHKLNEREKRKKFVADRTLTDVKIHASTDKKRSKEEKELREKLKVFMRFMPQEEMDRFVRGLVEEREVRTRIEMLKEGRLNGARTADECQKMHTKAIKKEMRLSNPNHNDNNKNNNSGSGNAAGSSSAAASTGTGAASSSNHNNNNHSGHGGSGGASGTSGGGETSIVSQRRGRRSNGETNNSTNNSYDGHGHGHGHGHHHHHHHHHHGHSGNGHAYESSREQRKGFINDIDIEAMAGSELLSAKEITLCKSLGVTPHQYLIVKEVMIRESARNGYLRKKDAKAIIKLDVAKVFKIYDYLSGCGWVRTGTSSGGGGGSGPGTSSAGLMANGYRNCCTGEGGGGGGGGTGRMSGGGGMSANTNKSQSERT